MIQLTFEKLSKFPRIQEPCTVSIPFAQGQLQDGSQIAVLDDNKPVSMQSSVTAKWPDGSVKWLLIHFLADLPGNAMKKFYLTTKPQAAASMDRIYVDISGKRPKIQTAGIEYVLCGANEQGLIHSVKGPGFSFQPGELKGFCVYSNTDEAFTQVVGPEGWTILEVGAVKAVLLAKGKHYSATGKSMLDFEARIEIFHGKPYVQVDYRIIHREEVLQLSLNGIELQYIPEKKHNQVSAALATSNYKSTIVTGQAEESLEQVIDATYLLYDANEHIPETFYGTFWADWSCPGKGGICATVFQAYQNFPKALRVSQEGLTTSIVPKSSPLTLYQGTAKTHTLFLHFHNEETKLEDLNIRSLQFQLPDRPVISTQVYRDAQVYEDIFTEKYNTDFENYLTMIADARIKAYGMLHWGDAPDPGYTEQGRGNGSLVWTNNEYDVPHAAMLMYARTGQRRMLDTLLVTARHQMDVDVCHFSSDPLRYQGQVSHSAHHSSGAITPSHEWVEGLLDYYYQTGDKTCLEVAIGVGENILRILKTPAFAKAGGLQARETGWALRSIVALYKYTHDEKWLEPAETIVDQFEAWKNEFNGWLAPYTDHTAIRVPFMIAIAVNSLMRYYRIRPQERIKAMILDAVYDMVQNCLMENGLFYYKELPSLRRLGSNPLVLEALAHAYELSGDISLLSVGVQTFRKAIQSGGGWGGKKQAIEDAIILWDGASPKRFGQYFLPLAYYYKVASDAGVI